ncbi:group II intron maturase-specific domain-containing protein, partial [Streptomyces sp. NPDC006476]|uniref:group II intron maturase-specific domain-containing protein n=1 Tax=Streptomyces sp. NPDC006476 TaxID=3157175 RepID=UPI0033B70F4D
MSGTKADAEALKEEAAQVLSSMGLRLPPEKTLITHIDEGLDFLGWRIQRHRKRGADKHYVYTHPARKALAAVMAKVKTQCRRTGTDMPFDTLLICLNRMLRGWCAYFRSGVSSAVFQYLSSYVWGRVIWWLRRKHPRLTSPPAEAGRFFPRGLSFLLLRQQLPRINGKGRWYAQQSYASSTDLTSRQPGGRPGQLG